MAKGSVVRGLVCFLTVYWIVLGVAPYDRADWALENFLTLTCGIALYLSRHHFPLSSTSYVLLFIFTMLHTLGAHYTYSNVPYERWGQELLGVSLDGLLGWERNNFDRVIHFLWGLLLYKPLQEWMTMSARLDGRWRDWYPLEFIMASSLVYELIEWAAAEVFGGELGVAYLGTQGDIWDAQKDMALATVGGVMAWGVQTLLRRRLGDAHSAH
ncbi:MAG: putative integral rane protein [Moraxellaceae bacterium]|jgi:putative membrane protein|nr:putative integral rane protein [Moraxellaceae bacterium]